MITIDILDDLEELRPIGREWLADHGEDFGIEVSIDTIAEDLERWQKEHVLRIQEGRLKAGNVRIVQTGSIR